MLFTDVALENLFFQLYRAENEDAVDAVINKNKDYFVAGNWAPFGENENSYGVIENQQSSPIPALIEKITNSIDAILMRKCFEAGIDPKSPEAPKSMEESIQKFFPDSKQWDLSNFRKAQAEDIQILADGPKMDTSLIIYDNGEGQHPEVFEKTFLSLLRGNKNEIHFVQGKYNMGGSGAIVFCGKKRYHLIASKRFDKTGKFGFTLIRKHPFTEAEMENRKNTWYEYLKIDGKIPAFNITQLDLGLYKRKFVTGTVLKLYSYDLPSGSRSVISRDLNQSINEYLFEPALPVYTIDKEERYPQDKNPRRELYGLKRRLEDEKGKYVEDYWDEKYVYSKIGSLIVTIYVFKPKIEDKTAKESRDSIAREFFKNDMSVLFSINGQVHGHFTSEFISRSLKMQLLKDHLIIHVDCTRLNYDIRSQLFMASRDRLKHGTETSLIRDTLAKVLVKSKLAELYKRRKDTISFAGEDKNELLRSFTKNLPLKSELLKLLNDTFKLDDKNNKPKPQEKEKKDKKGKESEVPFKPERFPTFFRLGKDGSDEKPVIKIPYGSEKSIRFKTDVENDYFVRIDEPGEFNIALLGHNRNDTQGGSKPGEPKKN